MIKSLYPCCHQEHDQIKRVLAQPAAAATCLEQGLRAAITQVLAAEPVAIPLLAHFPVVYR